MIGNAEQRSAQRSGLGPSEYVLEPILRQLPQTQTLPPFRLASRGQRDVAPSTIRCALPQGNESVALKGPQIVTERRTIGRQSIRELRQGGRVRRPIGKLHQDCKLGRSQPCGLERRIVKLSQPSRGLAQRRRVARTDAES